MEGSNSRVLWQGLRTIMDYRATHQTAMRADASLADELNNFFARFESDSRQEAVLPAGGEEALTVMELEIRRMFRSVSTRKAVRPDGISGRVLKACTKRLVVFTTIFNLSLSQCVIPTCFKKSVAVPVPKTTKPSNPNDYQPIALTSVVMKCLEKQVKTFITSSLPPTLDPLQFAYRPDRFTDYTITFMLRKTLSNVDTKMGNYVRAVCGLQLSI